MQKKSTQRRTIALLALAVGFMFGFSFALVPLYKVACKKIGLNTSIPINNLPDRSQQGAEVVASRDLLIQFVAMTNRDLAWDFSPDTKFVKVHPGARTRVVFYAKNNTSKEVTVQAIPSMTPAESTLHFHKVECFCFDKQTLKAGESKKMALVFQVDKDLPKDVHTITLAYTLFDVTPTKKLRS